MWKIPPAEDTDERQSGSLFAADAFVRPEHVEIFDTTRDYFDRNEGRGTALVRGNSGTGKSAILECVVSRIRDEATDVLVVRSSSWADSHHGIFDISKMHA